MAQVQHRSIGNPFATDSKAPLGNVSAREQKPGDAGNYFTKLDLTRQQQILTEADPARPAGEALIESNEQLSDPEKKNRSGNCKEFMTKLESGTPPMSRRRN